MDRDNTQSETGPACTTLADEEDWIDDSPPPHRPICTRIEPNSLSLLHGRHLQLFSSLFLLRTVVINSLKQAQEGLDRYPEVKSTEVRARHLRHLLLLQDGGATPCCDAFIIQPNDAFTAIRKVVLSYLMDDGFIYEVHLDTEMIQCVSCPSKQWRIPEEGLEAAREFRSYAENMFRSVKGLHGKLIDRGIVDDPHRFRSVGLLSCPMCSSSLLSCTRCDIPQACSNDLCPTASLNDMLACATHRWRLYCRDCVKNAALLARCPICHLRYCREDLSWCLGSPVAINDDQYEPRWHSVPRSHQPIPGPCDSCVMLGRAKEWFQCDNTRFYDSKCPSWRGYHSSENMRTRICLECAPAGPLSCRCGWALYCGTCTETGHVPRLGTCPQCRTAYCLPYCNYIDKCIDCGKSRLCVDCMEDQDVKGNEDAPSDVRIARKCDRCRRPICAACADDGDLNLCRACKG